jgi:hypothetical protein
MVVDQEELRRHQADFGGFMKATTYSLVGVIVLLVGMAIFLL